MSLLLRGLRLDVASLETYGGMGRIYTLVDPSKILKIADIRRSWCKYEPANYKIMERLGIPGAAVYVSEMRPLDDTVYTITVMERLEFTMTAYIRSAARLKKNAAHVVSLLCALLDMLAARAMVYCDLSPDNIMFRSLGNGMYGLALIDPQFLVPLEDFRIAMSPHKANSFDTMYLALKVQAIGLLEPGVQKFTDAVCAGILGHTPLEKHTRRWLLREAPVGLFMAYRILRRKSKSGALPAALFGSLRPAAPQVA